MARRRMIDPNFWGSEDVSKLNHTERLMLIGMFSTADDYGKGRANAAYIRSSIFPYEDISLKEIEKNLAHIQDHIEIIFYEIGDGKYYKFKNWRKWQKVDHPTDSIIPEPQDSGIIREQFENDSRNETATTPPNIINISKDKDKAIFDFFESIWKLYPEKKGKGQVSKTQKEKLLKIGIEQLSRCIERYKKSKPDWQAWQNGSTFFNSGYVDYMDTNYQSNDEIKNAEVKKPTESDPGFIEYCKALDKREQQRGNQ